ncbi:MAG: DNA-3-methyladenine glycosylase 2 family protein [Nitrosopumilaceae archaeon]|nr:DNA-3-methyladenine glycosylase 2 family protein [Nitrosopumilaceae archaeon]NIP09973.1 DNA-3-methyladenine glycosylase 2 family protein [Nitrosopumilaceae archaeon]NIS94744.1 DNA-3-methyladenine glycosylase 2 family protein [Nitrosopumilaceae archaeon]
MKYENAIKELQKDSKLKKIIDDVGPCKIRVMRNRYEAIIDAIITQQISDAAGKAIGKRFRDIFPKYPLPNEVLSTDDSTLLSSGISKMKVQYIKNISSAIISNQINLKKISKKEDEAIINDLTQIKGIGRWTAEMFLIFGLGRLDILPLGDLGLRNGIQTLYSFSEKPSDEIIIKIAQKWRPYRTVATWYIWKGVRNFKNV